MDAGPDTLVARSTIVDINHLRQPSAISFDTAKFCFRECVAEALGLDHHDQLSSLGAAGPFSDESHKPAQTDDESVPSTPDAYVPNGQKNVGGVKRGAWRGPSTPWIQKWKAAKHTPPRNRFDALYFALLQQLILPHINDPLGICFQREPTFRCHVSGGGESTGSPHIDADYGHQPTELNFWVPMTAVWGSNSLFAESAPGRGDFEPFTLPYGELMRFWGNQVRHYTVPNTTGSCRVSLDFRVVPKSCFIREGKYPNGTRRDGKERFKIGEFYLEMDAEGRVYEDEERTRTHVLVGKRPCGKVHDLPGAAADKHEVAAAGCTSGADASVPFEC